MGVNEMRQKALTSFDKSGCDKIDRRSLPVKTRESSEKRPQEKRQHFAIRLFDSR